MKKKSLSTAFLTAIIISLLILVVTVHFGTAQGGTNVSGIINSDTTWTQANSPYTLTGNVLLNNGVALTIESGAIVNLNSYYMRVNGTLTIQSGATINFASIISGGNIQVNGLLVAVGSSANPIHINGVSLSSITFSQSSTNWNDQVGSGCIIQNAIINSTSLSIASSLKIDNNNIIGSISTSGSTIISNNNITGSISASSSAVISNNTITGVATILSATVVIYIASGSSANNLPIVANNTIFGGVPDLRGDLNEGIECNGYASITNNIISGCSAGVDVQPYGNSTPSLSFPFIDRNVLINNQVGIEIFSPNQVSYGYNNPLIQLNLLTNNVCGISIDTNGAVSSPATPSILNNNIYANSNYNVNLGVPYNMNATYNWWGTTDTKAINQTIYDFKDDFSLGNVTYVPFLTAPSSGAPTYINASAGTGGSIIPSGYVSINYGGSQTFNITANNGYHILDVLVNGSSVGTVSSYTVQNVNAATTISVTFAPDPTPTPTPTVTPTPTPIQTPTKTSSSSSTQPTSSPTASPSQTPVTQEFPAALIVIIAFMIASTVAVWYKRRLESLSSEQIN